MFNATDRNFLTLSNNQFSDLDTITDELLAFMPFYAVYSCIALNRFKWTLPEEYKQLDYEFLEKMLYYKGRCALVKDQTNGYMFCDYKTESRNYNFLGKPKKISAMDYYNGGKFIGEFEEKDFVIFRDNIMYYPTNITVWKFCTQIANLELATDTNINQQKFPIIFQGTNEQKTMLANMCEKIQKNENYIFLKKEYNVDDITKLLIDSPFLADKFADTEDRKINRMLTMLGVNNENVNKQSGITTEEVNANDEIIQRIQDTSFDTRQEAVDETLEKFGITLKVELNDYTPDFLPMNDNTDEPKEPEEE